MMITPKPKAMPYKKDAKNEPPIALAVTNELTGKQKLNELKKPIPKKPSFDVVVHLSEQDLFEKRARYRE